MPVWAARDQDGSLAFFSDPPKRPRCMDPNGVWQDAGGDAWEWSEKYGPDPLPALTWEDAPVRVRIVIEVVKEEANHA